MANANPILVYKNAIATNITTLTERKITELVEKIKKYKLTNWSSCSFFMNVSTNLSISDLETRYSNALIKVTEFETEKDKAVNDVYTFIKPYIKSMIEGRYIPHIQDVIMASETENSNNSEISSALKALAVELSLKNIHVLLDDNIAKSTLERKIIDIIRNNTVTGSEVDKLNVIRGLNGSNQFVTEIFSIVPGQTADELESNIWNIMTSILYEVKSIDEIKAEVHNNPILGNREKPLGHEINEILNALPPVFKELIKYKMMTNIPRAKQLSQKIATLDETDYLTEIDMLLMTIRFDASKQVDESNTLLSNNTEAFIDFRYLQKLSSDQINELLSSLSVASYMILNYTLNNDALAKKDLDVHDYNNLSSIFSREEFDELNDMINRNNLDYKTTMYYYAFLKNYIGTRTLLRDDKKFKNIDELFKVIRSNNNIVSLGSLFSEWYENINLMDLSVEEINELTVFSPEFMYQYFSQQDKLIYLKCKDANIKFEYYYKLNPQLFDSIITLFKEELNGQSIPYYYFNYTISEIDNAYKCCRQSIYNIKHLISETGMNEYQYNGMVSEDELKSSRVSLLAQDDYTMYQDLGITDLSEIEFYIHRGRDARGAKINYQTKRADTLKTIIEIMKVNGHSPELSHYSTEDIEDARIIMDLSAKQRINYRCYLIFEHEMLQKLKEEEIIEFLPFPTTLKELPVSPTNYEEQTILQEKKDTTLARELPKMKDFEPTKDMKFLTKGQLAKNMELFFHANNDFVATPSFLYKTPNEVLEIVKLYQRLQLDEPLPEEILYFTNSEIEQDMPKIAELIQNEKDAETFSMDSIEKIRKIIRKHKERAAARKITQPKPNINPFTYSENELGEMFVTIMPEHLGYQTSSKK